MHQPQVIYLDPEPVCEVVTKWTGFLCILNLFTRTNCPHSASWRGLLPCCGQRFHCCDEHRFSKDAWLCCGLKHRGDYITWVEL